MCPTADLDRFGLLHSACRSRTLTPTNNNPLVSRIANILPQRARHAQLRPQLISWSAHKTVKAVRDDNCAPVGYYAASSGNSLPTFRDNLSVPMFGTKSLSRNVGKELPLLAA
jgi:hypothetical protein